MKNSWLSPGLNHTAPNCLADLNRCSLLTRTNPHLLKIDGSLVNIRSKLQKHGRSRRMLIWTYKGTISVSVSVFFFVILLVLFFFFFLFFFRILLVPHLPRKWSSKITASSSKLEEREREREREGREWKGEGGGERKGGRERERERERERGGGGEGWPSLCTLFP